MTDQGLRLPQGDVLLIRLPENPTTGYRWQFSQSGSGALQVSEDRFEAHPHSDAAAPGANGLRVIRFNATQRGQVRVEASEQRSWQSAMPAPKTLVYLVDVV